MDTPDTVRNIRAKLSSLDECMKKVNGNVDNFNQHLRTLIKELNARGEDTKDFLVNLFKGYMSTTDENFTRYIQAKQDAYDDQTITMDEEKLMLLALNKYKILVEQGNWSSKNKQEEKIIAL